MLSMAYVVLVNLSEVAVKRVHMYSAAAVALAAKPRRGVSSAAEQVGRDAMFKWWLFTTGKVGVLWFL